MQELPSQSMFFESLNSKFLLDREGSEKIELELIELRNGYANSASESFALLFRGPGTFVLPQQIYTLNHERLGLLNLFLVPVGRDSRGTYYEVIFNLVRNS